MKGSFLHNMENRGAGFSPGDKLPPSFDQNTIRFKLVTLVIIDFKN